MTVLSLGIVLTIFPAVAWEIQETKNFSILYKKSGSDAVPLEDKSGNAIPDYVDSIKIFLEKSWVLAINEMGYVKPKSVSYFRNTPLDTMLHKYVVFLVNVEDIEGQLPGNQGVTTQYSDSEGKMFGTNMSVENDLIVRSGTDTIRNFVRTEGEKPFKLMKDRIDVLKSIVAHEFFHAVQYEKQKQLGQDGESNGGSFKENSAEWFSEYMSRRHGGNYFKMFLESLEQGLLNTAELADYPNYRYLKYLELVYGVDKVLEYVNFRLENSLPDEYAMEDDVRLFLEGMAAIDVDPAKFLSGYCMEISKIYAHNGSIFKDEEEFDKYENPNWPLTIIKKGTTVKTKAIQPLATAIHKINMSDFEKFNGFEISNSSDAKSPVFHILIRYPSKVAFILNPKGEQKTGFEFNNSEYVVVFSMNAWANATVNFTPKENIGISNGKPNFEIYENWIKLNHMGGKRYQLIIEFKKRIAEYISIELSDIFGRPLAQKIDGATGSRSINHVFSLNSEFTGVVFVNFKIGNSKFVKRIAVTGL